MQTVFTKLVNQRQTNFFQDDTKALISKIAESVRVIRKDMVPKNKVLVTIFEIPGQPYIELQVKPDDSVARPAMSSKKKPDLPHGYKGY
jgi:hypothetical protein